jgi:hypothetical protein
MRRATQGTAVQSRYIRALYWLAWLGLGALAYAAAPPAPQIFVDTPVRPDPDRPLKIGQEFYPAESVKLREEGTCVVRVTVDKSGDIHDPQIITSTVLRGSMQLVLWQRAQGISYRRPEAVYRSTQWRMCLFFGSCRNLRRSRIAWRYHQACLWRRCEPTTLISQRWQSPGSRRESFCDYSCLKRGQWTAPRSTNRRGTLALMRRPSRESRDRKCSRQWRAVRESPRA